MENVTDEMKEFAEAAIVKLDETNEKRKNTPTKKQKENAEIVARMREVLTATPQTAMDVAAGLEISTQKASALLRQLMEAGVAVQTEVKGAKGAKVKAYALAEDVDTECAECAIDEDAADVE